MKLKVNLPSDLEQRAHTMRWYRGYRYQRGHLYDDNVVRSLQQQGELPASAESYQALLARMGGGNA